MNPNKKENEEIEIQILPLLKVLLSHIKLIIAVAILFGIGAFLITKVLITPTYRTSFTIYVNNNTDTGKQSISQSDLSASRSLADTYAHIILGRPVLEEAAKNAGINISYEKLTKCVSTQMLDNTELIRVYVSSESPEEAQTLANNIMTVATQQIADIIDGSSMRIVEKPVFPKDNYLPNTKKNVAIGAFIGAFLVCAIIILDTLLDDRVKSDEDLEKKYNIYVLGKIPNYVDAINNNSKYGYGENKKQGTAGKSKSHKKRKSSNTSVAPKMMLLKEKSPFLIKESYRALRTNLMFSLPDTTAKCIGFTSALRGEGKSTNAINLALSLSQIGKLVLIIDCDLRLPTIASKLGVESRPGLSNLLIGEVPANEVLRHISSNLDILPAGSIPKDPTNLIESKRMEALLEKVKEIYDYVIIDLPPVTMVTDAAMLSKYINGYLLVVRHNKTEYKAVSAMLRQMNISEAKVLGFLYNDAQIDNKKEYYAYT